MYTNNVGDSNRHNSCKAGLVQTREQAAGRTRTGVYYKDVHKGNLRSSVPEIQRDHLCDVVLMLLRQNVEDVF